MEHESPVFSGFPAPEKEMLQNVTAPIETPVTNDITAERITTVTKNYQSDNQTVSLERKSNSTAVTFDNLTVTEFVTTLDVTDLKHQMRNWYKRRMNTPDNLAKYKAGKKHLTQLGIPINEISKTALSYKKL